MKKISKENHIKSDKVQQGHMDITCLNMIFLIDMATYTMSLMVNSKEMLSILQMGELQI